MRRRAFVVLAFLSFAACSRAVAVNSSTPPQQTLTAAAIDSVRLIRDLSILSHDSMQGRAVATPGGARARAYLDARFREIGLQPFGNSFAQPFTFARQSNQVQGINLVGFVRGNAQPERYIVITAHYDHVGVRNGEVFNGADDNASGTAALLALADYFVKNRPRHSIIFAAFDAEEVGLQGARAFVANPPVPKSAIALNINMDMVSRNDAGELYVAGTFAHPQLLPFVERVIPTAEVKLIPGHDRPGSGPGYDWTNQSDQGAFHAASIPFLYFGVEDHPDYHRATDDFERIQPGFYVRVVRTILSVTRAIDAGLN